MPDLEIKKGKTFSLPFRLETEPICRKAISAIDFSHGAPRITVSAHGIPDGWRVYCYGISGPVQLNAECPDHISDLDGHCAYHEQKIKAARAEEAFWQTARSEAIKHGVAGLIGVLKWVLILAIVGVAYKIGLGPAAAKILGVGQ